jgi:phospholipid/cholesterol/gamma-HCH transport system substrate-binding protein
MPSQQEVKWSQLKVGLIVLGSTTLLCILLFLMTSASGLSLFSHKIIVDAYFADSSGLKKGGEVDLEGVPVGEVKSVLIATDPAHKLTPVHVILKLEPKFQSSLHVDSKASLTKAGLVGDTVININSQVARGAPLQSGDTLPTVDSADMDAVMQQSKNTLQTLNSTLGKLNDVVTGIQQGQGTVGQLIKNRELYDNLDQTTRGLNDLVANINAGHGSVGKLLHDDELYNHLNETATKLDSIATGLQGGKGSAGKLLTDDELYNNLNSSLRHLNVMLTDADQGKGALGLMTRDQAFAHKLDDTVTNLDTLLVGVNAGKGTLGKLSKDDQAYDNLNALLKSSNDLVTTIRQDPKKYLTIHMKIF